MDFTLGHHLSAKLRLNICACLLLVAILSVSGERTLGDILRKDSLTENEIQRFWDMYIYSKLASDLSRKYGHTLELSNNEVDLEELPEATTNDSGDEPKQETIYRLPKRIKGVAGLDTMDRMMTMLDTARKLPMSSGMKFGKLQQMMRKYGKK